MSAYLWLFFLPQIVSAFPCGDAVERQLDEWGATDEVLQAPGGPLGGAVYRIATRELGVWITLHQPRGLDTVSLFRTSGVDTVRLDFGPSCTAEPTAIKAPSPPPNAFTDEDLKAHLAEDDRLIVYLWSPHLPLSVEGYHEIAQAAAELDVPFVAVVDGTADASFVRSEADANKIPEQARRPLGAVELLFRDLAVHTPSIIVFSGGTVSAPLPGYRSRGGYRLYLEPLLCD